MKQLLTLSVITILLTSCGKVDNPVLDIMTDWGKEKNKESYDRLIGLKLEHCGNRAYNSVCTDIYPTRRLMMPHEFFTPLCYNQYIKCLESNSGK